MKKYLFYFMFTILFTACSPSLGNKETDVIFKIPINVHQRELFLQLMVNYGHDNSLRIAGPSYTPAKNGKDFVLSLGDRPNFVIDVYTFEGTGKIFLDCHSLERNYTRVDHDQLQRHTKNIDALLIKAFKDSVIEMEQPQSGTTTKCINNLRKGKLIK